jgi:DNA-binding protein H-NS
MARNATKLSAMDVHSLLALRTEVDNKLAEKRREMENALARLGGSIGVARRGGPRVSKMKGSKVAPKFRGPGGETWAGRGLRPKWLTALIKQGRKIEEFAINKGAASSSKRPGKTRKKK